MSTDFIPVSACARINGRLQTPDATVDIIDPYRGDVVGRMPISTTQDCDAALDAARGCRAALAGMPGYERAAMLRRIADTVAAGAALIGEAMARETGKAIRDCRAEVLRSAETLRLCAEEAVRIEGSHVPLDASGMGAGKLALTQRFPRGVVAAITPFNGPVNLAAHKLGPALASGNTIVIKPSPKAPLSLFLLIEAVHEAGVPEGAVNTLYGDAIAPQLVRDDRVDFVSFTGSIPVGRIIRQSGGLKPMSLELGGVGPTFVCADADIDAAAAACARNGLLLAGQSCISVQNVYVHRSLHADFVERARAAAAAIRFGDPLDPQTEVGTLIDEQAAMRVEATVQQAISAGARPALSGSRQGAAVGATLLTDVAPTMTVVAEEIFGPVITVQPFEHLDLVFQQISDSPFGLQMGIFTNSVDLALKAHRQVRTGGVIVNGTSRWRSDQMPYGGVKDSGMGREGPRYAIQDMTEERLLVFA